MKLFSLMGAFACVFYEKSLLEKKWQYYDRFYPEPTQLQKTLVQEAYLIKERDARGFVDKTLEEKKYIDPETERLYNQMYQLPPQRFPEAEVDVNPASVKAHYGKSWKTIFQFI